MRLVTPPLVINEGDNFTNDIFEREKFAIALTNVIKNSSDPMVIGLDGKWGEGKSTFVKMWQQYLNSENMPAVYIDAFSNDHADNAFMVVASAITDYVKAHAEPEKTKELINKSIKVGAQLLTWSAKLSIKALTLGLVKGSDIEELSNIGDDISESFSSVAEKLIEEQLKNHKQDVKNIEAFKEFLSTLPEILSRTGDALPLTIIIDELDRCRPSFAIEMLEKIKHLFSVKKITFVLVMNKKQIEESIKSTYGANIDAHAYLQKFISIETSLPRRKDEYKNDTSIYCSRLQAIHEIPTYGNSDLQELTSMLGNYFDLTLRQLEKVYSNIALIYLSMTRPENTHVIFASFFSVLKVVNPDLFMRIYRDKTNLNEILEVLDNSNSEQQMTYMTIIKEGLTFCFSTDSEYNNLPADHRARRLNQMPYSRTRKHVALEYIEPLVQFSIL